MLTKIIDIILSKMTYDPGTKTHINNLPSFSSNDTNISEKSNQLMNIFLKVTSILIVCLIWKGFEITYQPFSCKVYFEQDFQERFSSYLSRNKNCK